MLCIHRFAVETNTTFESVLSLSCSQWQTNAQSRLKLDAAYDVEMPTADAASATTLAKLQKHKWRALVLGMTLTLPTTETRTAVVEFT